MNFSPSVKNGDQILRKESFLFHLLGKQPKANYFTMYLIIFCEGPFAMDHCILLSSSQKQILNHNAKYLCLYKFNKLFNMIITSSNRTEKYNFKASLLNCPYKYLTLFQKHKVTFNMADIKWIRTLSQCDLQVQKS